MKNLYQMKWDEFTIFCSRLSTKVSGLGPWSMKCDAHKSPMAEHVSKGKRELET